MGARCAQPETPPCPSNAQPGAQAVHSSPPPGFGVPPLTAWGWRRPRCQPPSCWGRPNPAPPPQAVPGCQWKPLGFPRRWDEPLAVAWETTALLRRRCPPKIKIRVLHGRKGPPRNAPCPPQTPAGLPSTAASSSATSAAACTAAWAATSPSSSTCATAPGPPPCSRWVPRPWGGGRGGILGGPGTQRRASAPQMVHTLASNGANSIWEHSLLDPAQVQSGRRKANPQDKVQ